MAEHQIDTPKSNNAKLKRGNGNDIRRVKDQNIKNQQQNFSESNFARDRRKSKGIREIFDYARASSGNTSRLGIADKTYVQNIDGKSFHHYFSDIHKNLSLGERCIVDLHKPDFYKDGKSLVCYDGKVTCFLLFFYPIKNVDIIDI